MKNKLIYGSSLTFGDETAGGDSSGSLSCGKSSTPAIEWMTLGRGAPWKSWFGKSSVKTIENEYMNWILILETL